MIPVHVRQKNVGDLFRLDPERRDGFRRLDVILTVNWRKY